MKGAQRTLNLTILLLLTFCVQFTDLKIGLVKLSEIILLLLLPILFIKKTNKYIFYFLVFFSVEAILSLVITYFTDFKYLGESLIKAPYIITVGRYLELITCMVLCSISYAFFKSLKTKEEFKYYINKFIDINLIIVSVFVLIYLAVIFDFISIDDTRIVYSINRLRGYFFEGGPFGLMLSFIFILTSFNKKSSKRFLKRTFLIVVIFFLARSKAGFLCTVVWIGIENYDFLKKKIKDLVYPIILIGLFGFYILFNNIGHMYVNEIGKIKTSLQQRPDDPNLMMGRISGVFIVPKMVSQNFFFGIGTGNYPLLRNNEEYRCFFPLPKKEIRILDAHGFGGIIDILVDNGFFGITIFSLILLSIYNGLKHQKKLRFLLIGFILLFLFGVQIYFSYPWILLGILLVKPTYRYNEISC